MKKLRVATIFGPQTVEATRVSDHFWTHAPLPGHEGPLVLTHRRSGLAALKGLPDIETATEAAEELEAVLDWGPVESGADDELLAPHLEALKAIAAKYQYRKETK